MDFCPLEHGKFIAYEATVDGHKVYAVGIRKGRMKVRCMISTCGTTHYTGHDHYCGYDDEGMRYEKKYPRIDIAATWTEMQPGADVHNKHRQKRLARVRSLALAFLFLLSRFFLLSLSLSLSLSRAFSLLLFFSVSLSLLRSLSYAPFLAFVTVPSDTRTQHADTLTRARAHAQALEKAWITNDWAHRMDATALGCLTVDAFFATTLVPHLAEKYADLTGTAKWKRHAQEKFVKALGQCLLSLSVHVALVSCALLHAHTHKRTHKHAQRSSSSTTSGAPPRSRRRSSALGPAGSTASCAPR